MLKDSELAFVPMGGLGSALAVVAARNGYKVRGFIHSDESFEYYRATGESKYLKGVPLDGIEVTQSIREVVTGAKLVFLAPKSVNFVKTIRVVMPFLGEDAFLGTGTKGFIKYNGKYQTSTQVIEQEIPGSKDRTFALSGPNFADQMAREIITGTTIASYNPQTAVEASEAFRNGSFKVQIYEGNSTDVEIIGAYKNVVALVMGFARTLKDYDENTGALILQKGLEEAALLCQAMGGNPWAITRLCGIGDYGLLMNSTTSRNVKAGMDFGHREKSLEQIVNSGETYEGIETAKVIRWLAKQYRVNMPLGFSAYAVINGHDPERVIRRLLK